MGQFRHAFENFWPLEFFEPVSLAGRDHALPAGARLEGSGSLFTQDSLREKWAKLPQAADWYDDSRFRAALEYLLENTYSHTLIQEAYPVAIEARWLEPGAFQLELRVNDGHASVIQALDISAPARSAMRLIYSTVPKEVRILRESGFWERTQPKTGEGGLLRFRWLERVGERWQLRAAVKMPGYSLAQYDPAFMGTARSFSEAVLKKIKPAFDPVAHLEDGIQEARSLVLSRKEVVERGWDYCQKNPCAPGTSGWEDWSTPARDQRLGDTLRVVSDFVDEYALEIPSLRPRWQQVLAETVFQLNETLLTLGWVQEVWLKSEYSSDPRTSPISRWGMK